MHRKLFVSSLAFKNYSLDEIIHIIKENKLDGVDLAPLTFYKNWEQFENNLNYLKKKFNLHKIKINALQGIFFNKQIKLFYSSKKQLADLNKHLRKVILISKKLKVKKIIIGSSYFRKRGKLDFKKADIKFIKFFSNFKKILKKKKIYFCLETIPKEYNEDYIYNFSHMTNLIKKINSKNILINFDTSLFHFNKFEFKVFSDNFDKIKNVQISEKNFGSLNKISKNNYKFSKCCKNFKILKSISLEMILNNPKEIELNNSIKNFKRYFS